MFRIPMVCALVLLAGSNWITVYAATVHKWVDDKGITHYADSPPPALETDVTQMKISSPGTGKATASSLPENYYSIANQWQRTQQERLQRMQLELQRAALKRDRSPSQAPVQHDDQADNNRYVLAYPELFSRRHRYKSYHPGPMKPQPVSLGAFPTGN
jgi:hypothetical protein